MAKIITLTFSFTLFLFLIVPQVRAASTYIFSDQPPSSYNYQTCTLSNPCGDLIKPNECWNNEAQGASNCGTPCPKLNGVGFGDLWSKYAYKGCYQLRIDSCAGYYETTSALVCSTADKYDSNDPPVMKWGSCNCGVGGQYKTCCSGSTPVAAQHGPIDNNSPDEAWCGSNASLVYCGQAGQPACGQNACATPTPIPTNAPTSTPTPAPAINSGGCSNPQCTYSDIDGRCYAGTGASGFNQPGCTYKCGPVTCPSGENTAPTPTPVPESTDCTIGREWSVSNRNPPPNTLISVGVSQVSDPNKGLSVGFKVDGAVAEGVSTANNYNDGFAFTKNDLNSRYPGTHTVYLTTGNESKVCKPSTTFTTVSDVTAPSPTLLPPKCINGSLTDTTGSSPVMKIAWTNPGSHPITWVDISTNPNFPNGGFYNKPVSGTSTTVPYDFKLYTYNSATNTSSRTTPLTLYPNITYYVRLFNDYAQSPLPYPSFTIPSCVQLSGRLVDNGPTPASMYGYRVNSASECSIGPATSDASGLYVIPSIPVGNGVCLRPPTISNYLNSPAPGGYDWQFAGKTNAQTCALYPGSNWCTYDLSVDNAYNFTYTPISTPTATSTPKPLPAWVKTSGGDVHENR